MPCGALPNCRPTSGCSLWHVLHLPLFFMLLVAGIVHVISVNVY
jgi:hypothetical protein